MDWFDKLSGISKDNILDVSIPKEKLIQNIKSKFLQMELESEWDNINDIVYHAILRSEKPGYYPQELHIIEVELAEPKYVKAIAAALQSAIPYQQIILFSSQGKYLLFEAYTNEPSVHPHQFSSWVYEEELMVDFSLGGEQQNEKPLIENDWETWDEFIYWLFDLFRGAESSGFICLRHLIDVLKIRENQYEREYIRPIIARLMEKGRMEYFNDIPFVTWSNATAVYQKQNAHQWWRDSIEDERFGIDREYESLTESDFTTFEETMELLNDIEYYSSEEEEDDWYSGSEDDYE